MRTDEDRLRAMVKEEFGNLALWVESSMGGTFGFPDCVVIPSFARPRFLELKGVYFIEGPPSNSRGQRLAFEAHPQQRSTIRSLAFSGSPTGVLGLRTEGGRKGRVFWVPSTVDWERIDKAEKGRGL